MSVLQIFISSVRNAMSNSAKMAKKISKKKLLKSKQKKMDFVKLLIKVSMRAAKRSNGVIKDMFLEQALRLDSQLEELESDIKSSDKIKGNA